MDIVPLKLSVPAVRFDLTSFKKDTTNPEIYKQLSLQLSSEYPLSELFSLTVLKQRKELLRWLYPLNELINLLPVGFQTTVQYIQHELRAILLALKHVYYSKGKSFLILSDSVSSLQPIFNLKYSVWLVNAILQYWTERLVTWAEENGKLSEAQAGFRQSFSTTDHIFTLNAIVEKSLSKRGGKLYTCFVDLKKAFDSVQRGPLFHILCQNGLSGKFLNALGAIYKSVVSCVRIGDRLTEFFDCPAGLRQGCLLSPMLFSLFINEIASSVEQQGMHGIQLLPGLVEIFLLLFADDIVLISDTPSGLQN